IALGLSYRRQPGLGVLILSAALALDSAEQIHSLLHGGRPRSPFLPQEFDYPAFFDFLLQTFTAVGMIVVLLDEEQQTLRGALRSLSESEDRFRLVFEHSGVGMALLTEDERFLQVNPAVARLFGYAPEELHGRPLADLVHPEE